MAKKNKELDCPFSLYFTLVGGNSASQRFVSAMIKNATECPYVDIVPFVDVKGNTEHALVVSKKLIEPSECAAWLKANHIVRKNND